MNLDETHEIHPETGERIYVANTRLPASWPQWVALLSALIIPALIASVTYGQNKQQIANNKEQIKALESSVAQDLQEMKTDIKTVERLLHTIRIELITESTQGEPDA